MEFMGNKPVDSIFCGGFCHATSNYAVSCLHINTICKEAFVEAFGVNVTDQCYFKLSV